MDDGMPAGYDHWLTTPPDYYEDEDDDMSPVGRRRWRNLSDDEFFDRADAEYERARDERLERDE